MCYVFCLVFSLVFLCSLVSLPLLTSPEVCSLGSWPAATPCNELQTCLQSLLWRNTTTHWAHLSVLLPAVTPGFLESQGLNLKALTHPSCQTHSATLPKASCLPPASKLNLLNSYLPTVTCATLLYLHLFYDETLIKSCVISLWSHLLL